MTILTIRTDKPVAEIGIYEDDKRLRYKTWQADRKLAKTLHRQIKSILSKSSIDWKDIDGIVVFGGPGSFTGLRIGISVANALSFAGQKPVITTGGQNWIKPGLKLLSEGKDAKNVVPQYGQEANVTKPKK